MPNLKYHPMLREIIYRLDYSKITSKPNLKGFYSSAEHPGYDGDTIFEGHGYDDSLWLSVNIIEGSNDLFIHTTLTSSKLLDEKNKFEGFNIKNTILIKVGPLSDGVDKLIYKIENNIFPYL